MSKRWKLPPPPGKTSRDKPFLNKLLHQPFSVILTLRKQWHGIPETTWLLLRDICEGVAAANEEDRRDTSAERIVMKIRSAGYLNLIIEIINDCSPGSASSEVRNRVLSGKTKDLPLLPCFLTRKCLNGCCLSMHS